MSSCIPLTACKGGWVVIHMVKFSLRQRQDLQGHLLTCCGHTPAVVTLLPVRQGYMPGQLYKLDSCYGNQQQLQALLTKLKDAGIDPLADIVINHRYVTHMSACSLCACVCANNVASTSKSAQCVCSCLHRGKVAA